MPSAPHRTALDHARRQLALLAATEQAYLDSSPYRLVHEHDARAGRYLVHVKVASPMPDDIARLSGDVVRGLRESLDALATSLAGTTTRFPIFESLVLFAQRARKSIAPMTDEAQAYLEELQPYHAIGGFRNGPLWMLQQLDTTDVLRLTGSVLGAIVGVNTQRDVSLVGEPVVTTGPFDDGAAIGSVQTKVVGRDPKIDMFLRADYTIAFTREGAGRGRGVVALLAELCDHVEHTVLGALEPTLSSPR
ncbi:MAG: hypothetical protein ABI601_06540 [bacterium]